MTDLKRNLQSKVNLLLDMFPVVLILGPRQSGKSTLSKNIRPEWKYFDLERSKDYDFITRDFDFFFREYSKNIIFDEAQECPQLFKELRSVIDAKRNLKNRFILTGSASPELISHASDSLPGRMAVVELGTFKMNELTQSDLPLFYDIFKNPLSEDSLFFLKDLMDTPVAHQSSMAIDAIDSFLKGGYPEPVLLKNSEFYAQWMENYFENYVKRDIRNLFPKLDLIRYQRFLRVLSELSGTIINRAEIGRLIDCSEVTVRDYLEIAHQTYLWRIIPSFEKSRSKSLVKMPKGIFCDSGLNHYLLQIDSREKLLRSVKTGQNFEAFAIEEMIKGLQSTTVTNWHYSYFRTKNGAEVDLILDGPFGVLPIEIKWGSTIKLKQLTSLSQFIKDHELPFGVVVNNGERIEMISPTIIQIPIQFL